MIIGVDSENGYNSYEGAIAMSAVIRLAAYDDLPQLLDLYRHLNEDDPVLDPDELRDLWEEMLADEWMKIIVAQENNILSASCVLVVVRNLTRGARPYGLIENVVTHADYRRRGLGRMVLTRAIELAREHNCYKVMLLTSSRMPGVQEFYERCGFQKGVKTGFLYRL